MKLILYNMQKKVGEQMIRFAICDDEPIIMQEISNQLSQYMNGRKIAFKREEWLIWIILA